MAESNRIAPARERTPQPWPPDSMPTVEQRAVWLKVCTDDERREYVEAAQAAHGKAARCIELDHERRLDECQRYRRLGQVVPGV